MRDVFVDVLHDQGRTAEVNAAHAPNPMPTLVAKIRRLPHVRDPRLPVTRLLEALAVRHPLVARFGFRTT